MPIKHPQHMHHGPANGSLLEAVYLKVTCELRSIADSPYAESPVALSYTCQRRVSYCAADYFIKSCHASSSWLPCTRATTSSGNFPDLVHTEMAAVCSPYTLDPALAACPCRLRPPSTTSSSSSLGMGTEPASEAGVIATGSNLRVGKML